MSRFPLTRAALAEFEANTPARQAALQAVRTTAEGVLWDVSIQREVDAVHEALFVDLGGEMLLTNISLMSLGQIRRFIEEGRA